MKPPPKTDSLGFLFLLVLMFWSPPAVHAARCQATTQEGSQCKRDAGDSSFCWQHGPLSLLGDIAGEAPAMAPPSVLEGKKPHKKSTHSPPPEGDHIEYLTQYFINGGHEEIYGRSCGKEDVPQILRTAGFGGKPAVSLDLFRHCQDVLRSRRPPNNPPATNSFQQNTPHRVPPSSLEGLPAFSVSQVIDGDTIIIETGQKVRYIGVNTPESHRSDKITQVLGEKAKKHNEQLVFGKEVRLKFDVQQTDKYGRLLAYVYVGDIFINAELVRAGYASTSTHPPNIKYADLMRELEAEARSQKRGLWFIDK